MGFLKLISSIFVFLSLISFSYASVEVFSHYDTVMQINSDNTININKTLVLKNVYDVGIVPGQIEFKIGRGTDGSIGNIQVDNVEAYDSFGNHIKASVRETQSYSVIVLDVYYPLLPGFEYKFFLNYDIEYEPGGIFFKSLQIPLRESTIPIQSGEFKVLLPDNYRFTYVASDGGEAEVVGDEAVWTIKDDSPKSIKFEYSYLPLIGSVGDMKGSYVFWILINVFLVLFLIYEVRKEIKKFREQYGQ